MRCILEHSEHLLKLIFVSSPPITGYEAWSLQSEIIWKKWRRFTIDIWWIIFKQMELGDFHVHGRNEILLFTYIFIDRTYFFLNMYNKLKYLDWLELKTVKNLANNWTSFFNPSAHSISDSVATTGWFKTGRDFSGQGDKNLTNPRTLSQNCELNSCILVAILKCYQNWRTFITILYQKDKVL